MRILASLLAALVSAPATAADWRVFPGPGTPIQDAIDGAASGDTIHVHPGLYPENLDLSGKDLTLDGVGPADSVVINASGTGLRVVTMDAGTLRDLTLTGGDTWNQSPGPGSGGGVHAGSLTMERCRVVGNESYDYDGGGICVTGDSVIVDSWIAFNRADALGYYGGGLLVQGGFTIVSNTVFYANWATSGGGAFIEESSGARAAFIGCVFAGNVADNDSAGWGTGGGLYGGFAQDCAFYANVATGGNAQPLGGAAAQAWLVDCRVVRNYSAGDGGGTAFCKASNTFFASNLPDDQFQPLP